MSNSAYNVFHFIFIKIFRNKNWWSFFWTHKNLFVIILIHVCFGTFLFRVIHFKLFQRICVDCPCWLWICVFELVEVCYIFETSSIPVIYVTNPTFLPNLPTNPLTYPSSFVYIIISLSSIYRAGADKGYGERGGARSKRGPGGWYNLTIAQIGWICMIFLSKGGGRCRFGPYVDPPLPRLYFFTNF